MMDDDLRRDGHCLLRSGNLFHGSWNPLRGVFFILLWKGLGKVARTGGAREVQHEEEELPPKSEQVGLEAMIASLTRMANSLKGVMDDAFNVLSQRMEASQASVQNLEVLVAQQGTSLTTMQTGLTSLEKTLKS